MKRQKTITKVLVTGGGTGGHLFPGIAVAEKFLSRFPEGQVLFVGTERVVDARALQNRQFSTITLKSGALKGKSIIGRLSTLLQMPLSIGKALRIIHGFKPDLVFGVGGYVTGPVVLAAKLLSIPTCIHEQNSIPGMANRLLGKLANKIFISIPGSETYFPVGKSVLTGNPVRGELLGKMDTKVKKQTTLLVLGGSQGAHKVNSLVAGTLVNEVENLPEDFKVVHQTGLRDEEEINQIYKRAGIQARVAAFFDDMVSVYEGADLAVSRAGATTLAELSVLQIPALLIPYPYAADNHQEKNASYIVEAGGAQSFREEDLNEQKLGEEIGRLLGDPAERQRMADRMGRVAFPQATEMIIDECLAVYGERRGGQPAGASSNGLHVW